MPDDVAKVAVEPEDTRFPLEIANVSVPTIFLRDP
jgi:hypothetical protein